MSVTVTLAKAVPLIERVIQRRLVPMIHGSPAIGKSDLVRQIAKKFNLKVIDERLSTADPTDLTGLPFIDKERNKASYYPFETYPVEGDELPTEVNEKGEVIHKYAGWLVFLDELPSALASTQSAAFKLILDRMVGQRKLHRHVAIVTAGNTEDDGAIVNPLPTPLQSRMINFKVVPNLKEWLKYALPLGLDYRISSYLEYRPDDFYAFDPNHDDMTFSAPRTWSFLNQLIGNNYPVNSDTLPLIAGTISEAVGRQFVAFVKYFDEIPKMANIVNDPLNAKMPENPSVIYALAGAISEHATDKNMDKLMQYIERMPMEFQVVTLRQIFGRKVDLASLQCVDTWINMYSSELW